MDEKKTDIFVQREAPKEAVPMTQQVSVAEDKVKILLDGLAAGECKGIKGATAYKIAEYAQQKGLV